MPAMQPLRVHFILCRPMVVPAFPIHLDALLAWAAVQEAEDMGRDDPWAAQENLPLARHGTGEDAVWRASQLIPSVLAPPETLMMTKRFDLAAMAKSKDVSYADNKNVIPSGTGTYKAFFLTTSVQWVSSMTAFAMGDCERIEELLGRVKSIGKLRRNGMGGVAACSVVPDARARKKWKLRLMPEPLPGYVARQATLSPPYWDKTRQRVAYEPLAIDGDFNVQPK